MQTHYFYALVDINHQAFNSQYAIIINIFLKYFMVEETKTTKLELCATLNKNIPAGVKLYFARK